MSDRIGLHVCALLCSVFISCLSQMLLKKASRIRYDSRLREYLNVRVIFAYCVFFVATLLTIYSYRVVPLSTGMVLESAGYFFITIFDRIFFRRPITKRKLLALLIIVAGIAVFAFFG